MNMRWNFVFCRTILADIVNSKTYDYIHRYKSYLYLSTGIYRNGDVMGNY